MITKYVYICEICKSEYDYEICARYCEAQTLKPCPFKVGDIVECYERYEEPKRDVVVNVLIGQAYNFILEPWAKSNKFKDMPIVVCHQWIVTVKNEHQMGKDYESYTSMLELQAVRHIGQKFDNKEQENYFEDHCIEILKEIQSKA